MFDLLKETQIAKSLRNSDLDDLKVGFFNDQTAAHLFTNKKVFILQNILLT